MSEISIEEYVSNSYLTYGTYVAFNRALPRVEDGLKISQRRILYSLLELQSGGKFSKLPRISGEVCGKYHPHGNVSIETAIVNLVRQGLLDGKGNFGYKSLSGDVEGAAAARYISARLPEHLKDLISSLLPQIPYVQSELDESFYEPSYLPFPLPISLIIRSKGIGCGTSQEIPGFTPKSLLEAYLEDDYEKLVPYYDLNIEEGDSDLESLWTTGKGRITYYFNLQELDKDSYLISGSPYLGLPNLEPINNYIDSGQLQVIDYTSLDTKGLLIKRTKGSRVDMESVWETLDSECISFSVYYNLTVADNTNNVCYTIGIKEWIHKVYTNYIKLYKSKISSELEKIDEALKVYSFMELVIEELVSNRDISDEELLSKIEGLTEDILKSILGKSLKYLRSVNISNEVDKLINKRDTLKKFNVKKYVNDTINNWEI